MRGMGSIPAWPASTETIHPSAPADWPYINKGGIPMTVEERIRKQRDQKLIALGYCTQVFNPDDVVEEGNNGI